MKRVGGLVLAVLAACKVNGAIITESLMDSTGNAEYTSTSFDGNSLTTRHRFPASTTYGQDPNNPELDSAIRVLSAMTNVLVIDNNTGDDTTAAADPYKLPWRTCFDIWDTNAWTPRGAIAASKPGDWIYFAPSSSPYYVPQIPLSIWGTNQSGLNLYIPQGASVIRTNFGNTNEHQYLSGQVGAAFGFVMLGNNSRFIHHGYLEDINNVNGAPIGWNTSCIRLPGIVTNYPAANFYVGGRGTIRGSYDVVVLQSANNYPAASGVFEGLRLLGNYDCINNGFCNFITRNLYVYTDGTFDSGDTEARALTINDGYFRDYGSTFIAASGTNQANLVAAVDLSQTTQTNIAFFDGSKLEIRTNALVGFGTNMFPMKIGKRDSTLAMGGMSGIAWGRWMERTPTSHVAVATVPPLLTYDREVDTNRVVTYGAGYANLTPSRAWHWVEAKGSYISGVSYITNEALGLYVIRAGRGDDQQPRYFSTNAWTGPYWPTNGSPPPSPSAYNPTNLTVTRTAF